MEKYETVKKRVLDLIEKSDYITLPWAGPFPDGHLEIVAVDKKKTDMLKYKLDPKAKYKMEAQRAGLEINVFQASKGFYLYLTIRPYMELMDAPEIPGITADDIEQRTDEMLCREVFKSFLPKLADRLDAKIISKQVPIASKTRRKQVTMKRGKGVHEPDFVVVSPGKGTEALEKAKAEAVECRMKYNELMEEMERMRVLGRKEKEIRADQYFSAFILDMGEVVDNLDRALADPTLGSEHAKGLEMIRRQFLDTIMKYNVELVDPEPGEEFDPRMHEGLSTKKESGFSKDTIVEVIRKGYVYRGSVIRPAQVITAS
jgi:molecular chaperone GrpE